MSMRSAARVAPHSMSRATTAARSGIRYRTSTSSMASPRSRGASMRSIAYNTCNGDEGHRLFWEERGVGQRVTVCKVADIPEGECAVVAVNQKEIAVFNVAGTLLAIDDICPHMGASLSRRPVADGLVDVPVDP